MAVPGGDKPGSSEEREGGIDGCSRKRPRVPAGASMLDGIRIGAHVGACFAVGLRLGDATAVARLGDFRPIAFTVGACP
jgi:hypothetical protein